MLFKKKNIHDDAALRLVAEILKKSPDKTYKVKTSSGEKTVSTEELMKFTIALASRLADGRYGEIKRCDTCGNFNRSGKSGKRGWCSPKEYTASRKTTDHCSSWTPMSKEQAALKERIDEHFKSLHTK